MASSYIQLVHTLNLGDAISMEVLLIDRLLREKGVRSEIICLNCAVELKGQCSRFSDVDLSQYDSSETAILFHFSLGSPLSEFYLSCRFAKKILIYHNMTPPEWFDSYNYTVAKNLRLGSGELEKVAKSSDLVIGDSDYNLTEVNVEEELKIKLPLAIDENKWKVAVNEGIRANLKAGGDINFLHVGRIAPNKCIEDVIKIFSLFHRNVNSSSKLWLVGHDIDTEIYRFELEALVMSLALNDAVSFVGQVADCELKAFYQNSDFYLCTSKHEGFCVPLIEAMYFGLPVVAFEQEAMIETAGDGVLFVPERDHGVAAEAIGLLLNERSATEALIAASRTKLKEYSGERFASNLFAILESIERGAGPVDVVPVDTVSIDIAANES